MQLQQIYKPLDAGKGLLYAWFSAMHSRVDLVIYGKSEAVLKTVAEEIYEEVSHLERIANFYDVESELSSVNQVAFNHPVVISKDLFRMIALCKEYNKRTFGCFDVTVRSENHDEDMIASIRLSADHSTLFLKRKETRIDLSGFLKGYALEKIRDILCKYELENALINMGNSSVLAKGNHPHGDGWKVDFDEAFMNNVNEIPVLFNECLTTSGNNSVDRKHIVCPVTHSCIGGMKSVSVITRKGTEGEALSTALFVADPSLQNRIVKDFDVKFYSY